MSSYRWKVVLLALTLSLGTTGLVFGTYLKCIHATGGGTDSLSECRYVGDIGKRETETVYDGWCDSPTSANDHCTEDAGTKQVEPRRYECVAVDQYNRAWDQIGYGDVVEADDCLDDD